MCDRKPQRTFPAWVQHKRWNEGSSRNISATIAICGAGVTWCSATLYSLFARVFSPHSHQSWHDNKLTVATWTWQLTTSIVPSYSRYQSSIWALKASRPQALKSLAFRATCRRKFLNFTISGISLGDVTWQLLPEFEELRNSKLLRHQIH